MEITLGSQTYIVDYTYEEGMKSPDPHNQPDDPDELIINNVYWIGVDEYGNELEHDITDMYNERFDNELYEAVLEEHNEYYKD